MALGAKNILNRTIGKLVETLSSEQCQDYNVMVIGYSLGAGICQLVAMDLVESQHLPSQTDVRCVSYGAPPVFKSTRNDKRPFTCPNVFSVVYNNDGLASASTASVTKLFMQIRAVNRLQMRRRDMIKLLWNPIKTSSGDDLNDENEDDDDDFESKTGSRRTPQLSGSSGEEWLAIRNAAVQASQDCQLAGLCHPAGKLYLFKRNETSVITRKMNDTRVLSENLRLRAAMFSHHMPWGYNALFQGFGEEGISPEDVNVLKIEKRSEEEEEDQFESLSVINQQLYPDLSQL